MGDGADSVGRRLETGQEEAHGYFRAWELSKQGHSGARKPSSLSNSERPVGDGEKSLGPTRGRQGRGASDSREKEASRSRGLCSPLSPPLQAVATLCISQADVMATQQLCGKEQWCPALGRAAPSVPAPVPSSQKHGEVQEAKV